MNRIQKPSLKYELNNIPIQDLSLEELSFFGKRQLSDGTEPIQIITFNLDFLKTAAENDGFKNICTNGSLVVADGFGITSLIRMKYHKKIERITGHHFFYELIKLSRKQEIKIALLGSSKFVQEKVIQKITNEFPDCKIVSALSPPLNFEVDKKVNEEVIRKLEKAQPDILFVALGSPRQEIWINHYKYIIGAKINMGIGSVLDYYSGYKKRAPQFMQQIGMEWFWRMISEPKRLARRYLLNDLPFYFKTIKKIYSEK
ncbi:MAG: WecB/TagA/CpsF family glycosyltransferase [Ignavibacteriales bacterium]|nr:WecB/TagA/CpsF family glycosyltransferase [Ignavibacteriales bacterium]